MLIYVTTRLISATAAFLYPGYASYKTLSQRPASEEDLERWLMYWSVLGCIVAVEYVAEWVICWFPFYYTIKTIFLLYLALPQTRGSSYLYKVYLQPFFETHEADIDRAVVQIKDSVYSFVQERLRLLWATIMAALGQASDPAAAGAAQGVPPPPGTGAAPQPTLGDPVSGPAALLGGLWRSYGPTIVASGASLFQRAAAQTPGASGPLFNLAAGASAGQQSASRSGQRSPDQPSLHHQTSSHSVLERRRQLEAELASLKASPPSSSGSDNAPAFPVPVPHQPGATGYSSIAQSASDADLRARVSQYEEVEVPSDVEGYDVGGPTPASRRPGAGAADGGRRTSWFGWGGQGDAGERAKRE